MTDYVTAIYNKGFMFIVNTWNFTNNKLCHNLQLKTSSVTDFITTISSKGLKLY